MYVSDMDQTKNKQYGEENSKPNNFFLDESKTTIS